MFICIVLMAELVFCLLSCHGNIFSFPLQVVETEATVGAMIAEVEAMVVPGIMAGN